MLAVLSMHALLATATNDQPPLYADRIERIKQDLVHLSQAEIRERYGKLDAIMPRPKTQSKIDHFVVLYMENHTPVCCKAGRISYSLVAQTTAHSHHAHAHTSHASLFTTPLGAPLLFSNGQDHFFGCMDLPGHGDGPFEGIKNHSVPADPSDPTGEQIKIECGTSPYVCQGGPGYDTYGGKFAKGAEMDTYPYGAQSDLNSALHGARKGNTAIKMFAPEQLPVKSAIAKEFGIFNKLYCGVASASSPNHLMSQSGTSCGMQRNTLYKACGGPSNTFPQMTIYDSLRLHNVSFGLYLNSTCGLPGQPKCTGHGASSITTPDVAMAGVARHQDHFFSQYVFYNQSANGTLPAFTWLLPPAAYCDHPCHDNAKGERLQKDVYEALRAGPKWNKTLFFVVYDDAGGYYDHMVPPSEGVPNDESPCWAAPIGKQPSSCGRPFDFKRLGLRSTAMLMSPWVPKGAVFQEPKKGPSKTSQFDETSILATAKTLFNLSAYLTKRDAWAGSFEELLLDTPREDCPMHLPDAPAFAEVAPTASFSEDYEDEQEDRAEEEAAAGRDDDRRSRERLARSMEEAAAMGGQHCSSPHGEPEQTCAGPGVPSRRQLRMMEVLAAYLEVDAPPVETMDVAQADAWITAHWQRWVDAGAPVN